MLNEKKDNTRDRDIPVSGKLIFVVLLATLSIIQAMNSPLYLEKEQVFMVRNFHTPYPLHYCGLSTWLSIETGYILRTPSRLHFYSHTLELTHSLKIPKTITPIQVINDSLIYILTRDGSIYQYDLAGDIKRRWVLPNYHFRFATLAVQKNKILIGGRIRVDRQGSEDDIYRPAILILDTLTHEVPDTIDLFLYLNRSEYVSEDVNYTPHLFTNLIPYETGFIAVEGISPHVFKFSTSGNLEWMIDTVPQGYIGLEANMNKKQINEWNNGWDIAMAGVSIINDTLLVVPRRITQPLTLDVYNLLERTFITRLEAPGYMAGATNGHLFFLDTTSDHFAQISSWRILPTKDTLQITDSASIANLFQQKGSQESEVCSGKSGCCSLNDPFGQIKCSIEELHVVETIPAGKGRIAQVVSNSALQPNSLFQFCSDSKKNMFIFVAPSSGTSHKLLDTLNTYLKERNDWILTTVVGYPSPSDLELYLPVIPGDQILINRSISVPCSTLAKSDIPQPPLALALSKTGKKILAGYSLSPYYDSQKKAKGIGITFDEFLEQCGLIESKQE